MGFKMIRYTLGILNFSFFFVIDENLNCYQIYNTRMALSIYSFFVFNNLIKNITF